MYCLFSGIAVDKPYPYVIRSGTVPDGFTLIDDWEGHPERSRLDWFKHFAATARRAASIIPTRCAIHGTVLITAEDRAILLIAERSGGKSATAAVWSEKLKLPVLCDDLVVFDERFAYVGPRLLPIRPNTARALELTTAESCLELHDAPRRAPIDAVYFLRTGTRSAVEQLTQSEAAYELSRRIFDNSSHEIAQSALGAAPFYRLSRSFNETDHTWVARCITEMECRQTRHRSRHVVK